MLGYYKSEGNKMAVAEVLVTIVLVILSYILYPYLHDLIYKKR